ncbi:Sodium-coupled neutral amino acid transporter 9 [Balamuthia mandrillaris]
MSFSSEDTAPLLGSPPGGSFEAEDFEAPPPSMTTSQRDFSYGEEEFEQEPLGGNNKPRLTLSGSVNMANLSTPLRKPFTPPRGSELDHKLRYYDSLMKHSKSNSGELGEPSFGFSYELPPHIIPSELFVSSLSGPAEKGKYQSSLTTIFSIWNTMMGSSLLALPWGFSESGFLLGLLTIFGIGFLCFYSCYLIVKNGQGYDDFIDLAKKYLGRAGTVVGFTSSVLVLVGALIAFDILMSDSLYENVNSIRYFATKADKIGETKAWSHYIAPLFIAVPMFCLGSLKSFSLLVRLNSVGILCVLYIITFVVVSCFVYDGIDIHDAPPLVETKFFYFMGLLMVSYFIHNCILPILKKNNPKNNVRDLAAAFALVGFSYGLIGGLAFYTYHRRSIPQNFLNFDIYSQSNIPAMIARFALLVQLATVYPLILCIVRIQFFGTVLKSQWPSIWHVLGLNFVLVSIGTWFAIFYPHIGTVLRFVGAICGFLYVFGLPNLVHILILREEGKLSVVQLIIHSSIILFGLGLLAVQFIP